MNRIILTLLLLVAAASAQAATFYVRPDGGTAAQCTGLADAAYPGSGTAQACAVKNPMYVFPPSGNGTALMAGGDTVIIKSGTYEIGHGAESSFNVGNCHPSWAYDCNMIAPPDGASGATTKVYGEGHDTGCASPPILTGIGRNYAMWKITGADYVDFKCLEFTDALTCAQTHCSAGTCPNSAPFLQCASDNAAKWASRAFWADGATTNLTFTDVNIHGMAKVAFHASGITDWTLTRVRMVGNPHAGWDGDGVNDDNGGTITFNNVEIAWNGCIETYPEKQITGCFAQQGGGYGDGFGTGSTLNDWVFNDVWIHHNTSDGFDLLYNQDGSSVAMTRIRAYGNGGNQVKANKAVTLTNSYIRGDCGFWSGGKFAMAAGDVCRAGGTALVVSASTNATALDSVVMNNTITSSGDCVVQYDDGTSGTTIRFQNNLIYGQLDYLAQAGNPGELACAAYDNGGTGSVSWIYNAFYNVKNNDCLGTNTVCTDPLVRNSAVLTFDPRLQATSPLRGAGSAANSAPTTDINGTARGTPPDIGAYERD